MENESNTQVAPKSDSGAADNTPPKDSDRQLNDHDEVYSVFSLSEKRCLVALASLAAFFSPLSANIYYAATPILAHDSKVSISLINLTVTAYLVSL